MILDSNMNIYVNNKLADMDTPVYDNFSVIWTLGRMDSVSSQEETQQKEEQNREQEKEQDKNEEPVQEPAVHSIVVLVNKTPVPLEGKTGYIFVDVFDKIDFDLSRPKGKGIVTTLNGRPAQYMEPIHDGDVIEIYWQE